VALILALAIAVAGGELAVSTAPTRPHVGERIHISATGSVNQAGGRLYIYRNVHKACADTQRAERSRGILLAEKKINSNFDVERSYVPHIARTEWVCSYLYGITCNAAGRDCAPAVGLPPDAGWSQLRIRVRPRSQSVKSAGASGRVIT
jgi:hypothetical protein